MIEVLGGKHMADIRPYGVVRHPKYSAYLVYCPKQKQVDGLCHLPASLMVGVTRFELLASTVSPMRINAHYSDIDSLIR